MTTWWERYKFKTALGLIMLFLFSCFMSCQEIKYSLGGKIAKGKLIAFGESRSNGMIEYEFQAESGEWYYGRYETAYARARDVAGKPLEVIYLPYDPRVNQLTLERTWIWPVIVLVMLGALAAWVIAVLRRAYK